MDEVYFGVITQYTNEKHSGIIKAYDGASHYFHLTKVDLIKRKKDKFIRPIHHFCVGDEVTFKLKQTLNYKKEIQAYEVAFIRNEFREKLIEESIQKKPLFGYLKLVGDSQFFIEHIATHTLLPLKISEWETDLENVYYNRVNELVQFSLLNIDKIYKLTAHLNDRKFSEDYKKLNDYFINDIALEALITGKNNSGYFAKLNDEKIDAFIPIPIELKKNNMRDFFRFNKGNVVFTKIKMLNQKKLIILYLVEDEKIVQ